MLAALPDRDGHARIFASWGTDDTADGRGPVHRAGPIGRSTSCAASTRRGAPIAPFVVARVTFEDYRAVEGFALPGRVIVRRGGERGAVVHRWTLVRARLGPAR